MCLSEQSRDTLEARDGRYGAKSAGAGVNQPTFEPLFTHELPRREFGQVLTPLCLCFLICKMGITVRTLEAL